MEPFFFAFCNVFLECFFHFFGSKFSEYANAVIVNIHYLNSLAVKVSWSVYYDFINKLMYKLRCQFLNLSYALDFVYELLQTFGLVRFSFKIIRYRSGACLWKRYEGKTPVLYFCAA